MQRRTRSRSHRGRPGVSSIVGSVFFILVLFVATLSLASIYGSFTSYMDTVNRDNNQALQMQKTSLAFPGFQFGTTPPVDAVASGGTTTQDATAYTSERKVVYSSGLWWDFYSSGTNIICRTSPDSFTWSAATTLVTGSGAVGGSHGYDFSVWLSGANTLYYSIAPNAGAGNNHFNWRYGALSSSGCGSITWTIAQTQITTTNVAQGPLSIETDLSGNTWVALTTLTGGVYHIEVWEHASGAGAGVWTKQNDIAAGATISKAVIESWPCSGTGCAVLVYGTELVTGVTTVISTTCAPTCATWTAAVSPASNYAIAYSSAVVIGSVLYFAGLSNAAAGQATGPLNFWSFIIGSASTSAESTIESGSSAWQAALGASTTTLVLFEAVTATNTVAYHSSATLGSTWSAKTTISTTETSVTGLTAAYSGTFAASWVAGAASPYTVKFTDLSTFSIQNNSPFAVHVISLYLYLPGTNTLVVHYDTDGTLPGVSAPFDYWIASGSQMDIPIVYNTFNWAVTTAYLATVVTSTGVVVSETVTSPA